MCFLPSTFCGSALRMLGYTQKDLVGQNIAVIVPEPIASLHQGFLDRYMETGDTHFLGTTRTVLAVRKGGDIIPVVQTTTGMENSFAALMQVRHTAFHFFSCWNCIRLCIPLLYSL